MNVHFKVENRKELVKALEELTREKAKYLGMPSCAYQIGTLTLSKDSTLSWNDNVDETAIATLIEKLQTKGFVTDEEKLVQHLSETAKKEDSQDLDIVISMPREIFTPETWENLNNLLIAKGSLIQKAFGLKDQPEVIEEDEKVTFPWFKAQPETTEIADAYSKFVCALVKMARGQKRVTAKAHEVDNEKFAFRCFLLRLGFIGKEYKETRKILLKNLTGSAAFKEVK